MRMRLFFVFCLFEAHTAVYAGTVHGYYQCYDGVVNLMYVAGKHMCSHVLLARGLRTRGRIIFGF